jgi:hypothetical protein
MDYSEWPIGERPIPENPRGNGHLGTWRLIDTGYDPIALTCSTPITCTLLDHLLNPKARFTTDAPASVTLPAASIVEVRSDSLICFDRTPEQWPPLGPLG